ncbi:RNA ligase 1 [Nerophis ophidion]|uniref:RNA ligase 1 n=1 Tax=Nerophis ophidion TaxID=159077 RepID=UPI002AE00EA2|nr:RNA ligase 1 [Nerophis ophidion]
MRRVGSVQQKVSCVFMTEVKEEASRKRDCQPFHVVATAMVNPAVLEADLSCAVATEKLDGTCCYVSLYKGKPHLWARLDRRPNKQAEKRFKKYQYSHRSSKGFTWNVEEDFKTVPDTWTPAHRVKHHNGHPVPDEYGHIPGWVPVEDDNKQYCWHSSVVDSSVGSALVLRPVLNNEDTLEIVALPLADLLEQTLELIGTNVNGNPYGMGSKKQPIHFLVSHGSICIRNPPPVDFQQLYSWFRGDSEGRIEGIVWHCAGGSLFKLHRHHLGLEWPAEGTHLGNKPVVVGVSGTTLDDNSKSLFVSFSRMYGRCFSRLHDVHFDQEIQSTT